MNNAFVAGVFLCGTAMALSTTSVTEATITLTPGDFDDFGGAIACDSGVENNTNDILATIESLHPGLVEYYKSEVDGGTEFGSFAADYTTTYSNTLLDPANAVITWDGPGIISCPDCFVLVKDGKQTPAWYLFDLATFNWDGKDNIVLTGFWPNQGAISHVSIMGSPVPVPAAVWLFGSGLLGLVGVARRKRA